MKIQKKKNLGCQIQQFMSLQTKVQHI